jgi:predicted alpha/beta hydrolase family esterase
LSGKHEVLLSSGTALVGHSTGCQNSIHFLKYGDDNVDNNYYITADYADATGAGRSLVDRIKVVVLQAPVSDRETDQDNSKYIQHARQLVSKDQGDEMMARSSFWAPITAPSTVYLTI